MLTDETMVELSISGRPQILEMSLRLAFAKYIRPHFGECFAPIVILTLEHTGKWVGSMTGVQLTISVKK